MTAGSGNGRCGTKIVFLGLYGTFDYRQIGGTDSMMRRVIHQLMSHNPALEITCLMYGSPALLDAQPVPRLRLRYVLGFQEALTDILQERPAHVVSTYVRPSDRFAYARFRAENSRALEFHSLLFFYPESLLKRELKLAEFRFFPYNGSVICVSERQYNRLRRMARDVALVLPPVPKDYFLAPEEKRPPGDPKLRVTFIGRLDRRKGVLEVIELFRELGRNPRFDCAIYGIHIAGDEEGLRLAQWLRKQTEIRYVENNRSAYSPEVEESVRQVLRETDVFVQPYRTLDSTVDTPLLVLEAMASLCAVLTTPVGDIPAVYGPSEFIVPRRCFVRSAFALLSTLTADKLQAERERIYERNRLLGFEAGEVGRKFLSALGV